MRQYGSIGDAPGHSIFLFLYASLLHSQCFLLVRMKESITSLCLRLPPIRKVDLQDTDLIEPEKHRKPVIVDKTSGHHTSGTFSRSISQQLKIICLQRESERERKRERERERVFRFIGPYLLRFLLLKILKRFIHQTSLLLGKPIS